MEPKEIAELLALLGWTKEKLADRCRVTARTVDNWLKRGCWTSGQMWFLKGMLKDARRKGATK